MEFQEQYHRSKTKTKAEFRDRKQRFAELAYLHVK